MLLRGNWELTGRSSIAPWQVLLPPSLFPYLPGRFFHRLSFNAQLHGGATVTSSTSEMRDHLLTCSETDFIHHCRSDRLRGSGRGGQKRNVTESAVRLTLPDFDLSALSDVSRSQHENRRDAIRRLRKKLALNVRASSPASWHWDTIPGQKNPHYPLWIAHLLDVLHDTGYSVGQAASFCNLSTGRLVKLLARDPDLWTELNTERQRRNLRTLKPPQS